MKWNTFRRSANVDDRRGVSPRGKLVGGGIGGIVIVLVAMYLGVNPQTLMQVVPGMAGGEPAGGTVLAPGGDAQAEFVAHVLGDTEDVWSAVFRQHGAQYEAPRLVLFSDATDTGCGMGESAMGPFYCPPDRTVYIDLSFYRQLQERFGAPGDFAQAYVIAHEVGHHVQQLAGVSDKVRAAQQRGSKAEANALSIRMELQADCYAGLWAHHAQNRLAFLEDGDVEEALTAAAAIGDDTLQRQAGGRVAPETWTHGSSADRVRWFRTGMRDGTLAACDTF